MLKDKKIILGITGSIAAHKIFELIKLFRKAGACLYPVMTQKATYFITPLSVEIACGNKVLIDMFDSPLSHIELARKADLFLIAPATANFINKYATGIADDLLTTAALAYRGPFIIAPAMNWRMYESHQVQKNIEYLKSMGIIFVGPEKGFLSCGEEGKGRLAEVNKIFETAINALTEKDLKGERILITAGPTRQYLDPIRFITNKSSGKMGYAIARMASRRGAYVKLISGPVNINPPFVDELINVETTEEMSKAVMDNLNSSSILIMAAAPLDFEPEETFKKKIPKNSIKSIKLKLCPDILKEISKIPSQILKVGFSAEWGLDLERAKRKFKEKDLKMIVLNDISVEQSEMGSDYNQVVMIYKKEGKFIEEKTPLLHKEEIANFILSKIKELKIEG